MCNSLSNSSNDLRNDLSNLSNDLSNQLRNDLSNQLRNANARAAILRQKSSKRALYFSAARLLPRLSTEIVRGSRMHMSRS